MRKSKRTDVSENVIQGNSISRAFYRMDVNEQRLVTFSMYKLEKVERILAVASKMAEGKEASLKTEDYKAKFSIPEMCETMGIECNDQTIQNYKKDLDTLPKRTITIDDQKHRKTLPLVILSDWNKDSKEVEICFNPYFFAAVFDAMNYSRGSLQIFGALKKHTSQRLYFYLLSYRNMSGKYTNQKGIWKIETTIPELRKMYALKDGEIARVSNFVQRYIKEPVAEINAVNYEFSVDFKADGKPISEVTFICCEKIKLKALPPNDSKTERQDTLDSNNEKKLMQKLKEKYSDEWAELLKEKINIQFFDFGFSKAAKLEMIEHEVFEILRQRHCSPKK